MKYYRIYNHSSARWSEKNCCTWSTKTLIGWRTLGHLKSHISNLRNVFYGKEKLDKYRYDNCEIIEYEMVETLRIPMKEFLENYEKDLIKKEEEFEKSLEERRKKERYNKFLDLKKEFGDEI